MGYILYDIKKLLTSPKISVHFVKINPPAPTVQQDMNFAHANFQRDKRERESYVQKTHTKDLLGNGAGV